VHLSFSCKLVTARKLDLGRLCCSLRQVRAYVMSALCYYPEHASLTSKPANCLKVNAQFLGRNRSWSCARTLCSSSTRRLRKASCDILCQFHSRQHLLSQRSPCARRRGAAAGGGWQQSGMDPQELQGASCPASLGSSLPSSLPLPRWLLRLLSALSSHRELLSRAALTLGLLAVIRAGHFIPLPGVDLGAAGAGAAAASSAGERLIKVLYGQTYDIPASLYDLGISPFVN
ncbi:hypothetical protein Agub_g6934, partial [Astrephomene gubernaculifera]